MKRLRELEEENRRLKKMYAEERLIAEIRKWRESCKAIWQERDGENGQG